MSTRTEKVEAQRTAFGCCGGRHIRHLIGPLELEHLLLTKEDHIRLVKENEALKARLNHEHTTETPKDTK